MEESKRPVIKLTQCVNAEDMPDDVEEWCDEHEIYTHCETGLHCVEDDGSPLSEWLKSVGFQFKEKGHTWLGVWGT
jgi:hypothetical protein